MTQSVKSSPACPFCRKSGVFETWSHLAWQETRFFHCANCDAVFVPEDAQVSLEEEKARYATHNNDLTARGFRDFLLKTVSEIQRRFPAGSRVLDFGSGPEPSLSKLLSELGYKVTSFDPHFSPVPVEGTFDLIIAHEVFEHLRDPRAELAKIQKWLAPDGTFLIRSEERPAQEQFSNWWYARDFTHIFFASEKTLRKIAEEFNWRYEAWTRQLWAFRAFDEK